MKKKGELSMNLIIIAAIALIILVVITVIFMSRMNLFSKNSSSCEENQGRCVSADESCPANYFAYSGNKCANAEMKCCKLLEGIS